MIKSITMKNIGSYKETKLETDKRINLIFGFNGTGKTLLSKEFMKNGNNIEWYNKDNIEILVFNTFYIHDNFLIENKSIEPIFYLGQDEKLKNFIQDKEAEKKELEHNNKQLKGELEENNIVGNLKELIKNKSNTYEQMYDISWNIYKNNNEKYKQCLFDNFKKNKKEDFFINYEKQEIIKTTNTEEDIYNKLYEFDKNDIKIIQELKYIDINRINIIINDDIFNTSIIGDKNNNISKYIDELGNQKWVKEGYDLCLNHNLPKCPFCQQETINENFLNELKNYFNDAYIKDIEHIQKLNTEFQEFKKTININNYFTNEIIITNNNFRENLNTLLKNIETKLQIIEKQIIEKINDPSKVIILSSIDNEIIECNNFIKDINKEILKSNEEYNNKEDTKKELIKQFWSLKKQELSDEILKKKAEIEEIENKINEKNKKVEENLDKMAEIDEIINYNKPKLIDVQKAVSNINQQLNNMGITDFTIKSIKNRDNLTEDKSILEEFQYTLDRNNTNAEFKTFSEGEKMIISFLYFIEECKSKLDDNKNIIVVIDDPISSLSSNNLFAIADIIKDLIKQKEYVQFFIMTHNLYFFDEIYRFVTNKKNDKNNFFTNQSYHIKKYDGNSTIGILNTNITTYKYILFWGMYNEIVFFKEDIYNVTLPNIMRNILEYFCKIIFNCSYGQILTQEKYGGKYKVLYRFVDKKSHSDTENEDKNLDVEQAIKLFEDFFCSNGYKEHYNTMKKITNDINKNNEENN
ncbi:AAA family ATPase [uncultured Brachyspira sp.]|uniref:AAA family ATPase n=1 Tax=uncultured Brachyspira sp. TaxID=221953 RepID=UPI00262D292E|nr:AAA family ATPase [uncultured Brachyspira sp.]